MKYKRVKLLTAGVGHHHLPQKDIKIKVQLRECTTWREKNKFLDGLSNTLQSLIANLIRQVDTAAVKLDVKSYRGKPIVSLDLGTGYP